MSAAAPHCLSSSHQNQPPQGGLAPGLRARVWIEASALFRREEARHYCWLWLHRHDGQVQALRLDARALHRDALIEPLLRSRAADPPTVLAVDGRELQIAVLDQATVVPQSRWSHSWGHPLNVAIRAFADTLDAEVLQVLGHLERPGLFLGTTANYSRLAMLPQPVRSHRLQALTIFPPLISPLLLHALSEPELFEPARAPEQALDRSPLAQAVLDAMDRGRDLSGALAAYWRVDRALIRSPLVRRSWPLAPRFAAMLRVLRAIPAQARPLEVESFAETFNSLMPLLGAALSSRDFERLGGAFAPGWNKVWQDAAAARAGGTGLGEARDFLRAALAQMPAPRAGLELTPERLALAWIARRGPAALIRASQRWHALPTVVVSSGMDDRVMPLLGEFREADAWARELSTREALIAEGLQMQHCVGDYWDDCVFEGTRIWHLELAGGEAATAEFSLGPDEAQPQLELMQLKGPRNAAPSEAMQQWATRLRLRLNEASLCQRRAQLLLQIPEPDARFYAHRGRSLRPLDLRLRRELAVVLAYCQAQPDWQQRPGTVFRGPIAGFSHGDGPQLRVQLQVGDPLQLVREADNRHDPLAVRVDWRGCKLGYVPRASNRPLAAMLDAGQTLTAQITAIHEEVSTWEQIIMAVQAPPAG